jgi:hypothetical protein
MGYPPSPLLPLPLLVPTLIHIRFKAFVRFYLKLSETELARWVSGQEKQGWRGQEKQLERWVSGQEEQLERWVSGQEKQGWRGGSVVRRNSWRGGSVVRRNRAEEVGQWPGETAGEVGQ